MLRSTKAQIQMGEMIAVIFVFMILLVFGLFFFFTQSTERAGDQLEERFRLDLLDRAKTMMSLPEIQCSNQATPDSTCVDRLRVLGFRAQLASSPEFRAEYQSRFEAQSARIEILYPTPPFAQTMELFNFTPQNSLGYQTAVIPITVLDPANRRTYLAMLVVEYHDARGVFQ